MLPRWMLAGYASPIAYYATAALFVLAVLALFAALVFKFRADGCKHKGDMITYNLNMRNAYYCLAAVGFLVAIAFNVPRKTFFG